MRATIRESGFDRRQRNGYRNRNAHKAPVAWRVDMMRGPQAITKWKSQNRTIARRAKCTHVVRMQCKTSAERTQRHTTHFAMVAAAAVCWFSPHHTIVAFMAPKLSAIPLRQLISFKWIDSWPRHRPFTFGGKLNARSVEDVVIVIGIIYTRRGRRIHLHCSNETSHRMVVVVVAVWLLFGVRLCAYRTSPQEQNQNKWTTKQREKKWRETPSMQRVETQNRTLCTKRHNYNRFATIIAIPLMQPPPTIDQMVGLLCEKCQMLNNNW